jgi:putative PEP-CTERM system integral membrane protein
MSNNFSQLLDLAIKQGHSRSSLMAEIKQSIIADYREKNPKAAIGIAVLIDEESGLIKIFAGDKDLGSEKFSQEASQLAQKILIDKIAQGQTAASSPQAEGQLSAATKKIKKNGSGILGKIIFWAYNVYFIFFNFSMAISLVFGQNFMEMIKTLEWMQAITFLGIFFLPVGTVIFVMRKGLQKDSASLMKLFFLFELPLAILLLISSSLIGQTTIFTGLSLVALLTIPLLLYLHFSKVKLSALAQQIFGFFSQLSTILLGYYALLFSFFLPLILIGVPKEYLADFFYYSNYFSMVNYPAMFIRLTFALIIFILILTLTALPYILLRTLWKITEKNRLDLVDSLGKKKAEKHVDIGWVIASILFAVSLFRWPDHHLLAQLSEFDQEADYLTQETAATPLIEEEEKLQKLVERKVNARHYYLFDKDETFLAEAYELVFESEIFANAIQTTFTNLAYPLVYWEERTDQRALSNNFQYLFGYPYYQSKGVIEENDMRFIVPEEDEEKNVLLTYREITVDTEADGLLAKVTIEEEYQNQTNMEQEIIYEFNLPDEVAFYDLKLGPNLEFSGVIAPKGAAQKVYERELQKRRDPALLEQTGPNQYRLRIFPVPGRNDFSTLQGQRQKVSFSYSVAQNAGAFALPHYTRESNVYNDASSSISLSYNGQISYLEETGDQITAIDSEVRDLCLNQEQNYGLSEAGRNANIIFHANDADLQNLACAETTDLLPLLKDYRLAIVYDTSFNNEEDQTLHQFAKLISQSDLAWLNEANIDLYKFNQVISSGERITGDNFKKLLEPIHFSRVNDFSKLGEITGDYDLIILVTSQDIDFSQLKNFPFSKPTVAYWVSEDQLPALNMEMTSGLWQTGGGASTSIEEAIRNFLIEEKLTAKYAENAINLNRKLSLQFSGLSNIPANNVYSADSALAMIANKALLQQFVSQQNKEVVGDINLLDQLDQAARQANLVSPYSSSIALVNQQQIDTLKQLMEQYNRFQDTQMIENEPSVPWNPWMPMPMIDDFSMKMMPSAPMDVNNFIGGEMMMQKSMPSSGLLSVDTMEDSIGGQSRNIAGTGGFGSGLSIFSNLASGASFIIGTGVIAVVGLLVYLLQQLRKKKK